MPELPEVERGRRIAERTAVGRRIERVRCDDDPIVFHGVTPRSCRRALTGGEVRGTGRHGKYLWLELDSRPWPVIHFGMTGALRAKDEPPLQLESGPDESPGAWPPRFSKLHLFLDDGGELVFTNARRLGRVRMVNDPRAESPIRDLGFDPLLDLPSARDLAAAIGRRTVTLKGLLLDQSFAAGVGNWIADEVLYQAGLDPRRRACSLDPDEVRRLRTKLGHVVRTAVRVDADNRRFPKGWLFHRRWHRGGSDVTSDGLSIRRDTVAGRTTAWVPERQR